MRSWSARRPTTPSSPCAACWVSPPAATGRGVNARCRLGRKLMRNLASRLLRFIRRVAARMVSHASMRSWWREALGAGTSALPASCARTVWWDAIVGAPSRRRSEIHWPSQPQIWSSAPSPPTRRITSGLRTSRTSRPRGRVFSIWPSSSTSSVAGWLAGRWLVDG